MLYFFLNIISCFFIIILFIVYYILFYYIMFYFIILYYIMCLYYIICLYYSMYLYIIYYRYSRYDMIYIYIQPSFHLSFLNFRPTQGVHPEWPGRPGTLMPRFFDWNQLVISMGNNNYGLTLCGGRSWKARYVSKMPAKMVN
jgi:hypothetical protein